MKESALPLIEEGHLTTNSSEWKLLLRLEAAANRRIGIRDITITFDDVTTFQPRLRLLVNGSPKLRDFPPNDTTVKLSFGGDWVQTVDNKPPIEIYIKSDGTNNSIVTAIVTGIEYQA